VSKERVGERLLAKFNAFSEKGENGRESRQTEELRGSLGAGATQASTGQHDEETHRQKEKARPGPQEAGKIGVIQRRGTALFKKSRFPDTWQFTDKSGVEQG